MLPLIGAKVEKETKDGLDLWCEESRLNVAEKKSEEKMKSKNYENITDNKSKNLRRSSLNLIVKLVFASR